ncbi:ABC transporter ATP-binding protein [Symbiobacterium thermophilum]|uniref:Oligopeptide ABC transporter ATP-binding protein n=2 Tax=Symbiobacterium thermophilum TaxID=2734 RepID=Q67QE8_SYMTH|nr:ABC transporter ATP-binding protein [Symbiobacterium thermophilum]BAD40095.1 oligopeptide ABC transporter ATP-binding protein [Symbiobacterium thermophilum IAM 14863]
MEKLLVIENLSVEFPSPRGPLRAVDGVTLEVEAGEIVGLIGESGSGKSTVLLAVMGLIARPGRILPGSSVRLKGRELTRLTPKEYRAVRGYEIGMVFQDPMTALNPALPIGEQVRESLRVHRYCRSRAEEHARVIELLEAVGIVGAAQRYRSYPHQFSGGMLQRVLIASALACNPRLLLADEPTTALDVTIQAQILDLLKKINRERHTAILLVSHDIGLAAEFCDRIAVMYAGRIVEVGPAEQVVNAPRHPYTRGLVGCLPSWGGRRGRLEPIPGSLPDLTQLPRGCAFADRCAFALPQCREEEIPLRAMPDGRRVSCIRAEEAMVG